jgi:hypothetical protein
MPKSFTRHALGRWVLLMLLFTEVRGRRILGTSPCVHGNTTMLWQCIIVVGERVNPLLGRSGGKEESYAGAVLRYAPSPQR